ncbi:hypothetical protein HanPSC8_Chr01g0026651 [Helianthus annuus]|nr:hypothetical protein HanPSC8_Chr01g0026651 [Helianthus annuus]
MFEVNPTLFDSYKQPCKNKHILCICYYQLLLLLPGCWIRGSCPNTDGAIIHQVSIRRHCVGIFKSSRRPHLVVEYTDSILSVYIIMIH